MSHRISDGIYPSISLLKELARKHKRAAGVTQRAALDFMAMKFGFSDWRARLKAGETLERLCVTTPVSLPNTSPQPVSVSSSSVARQQLSSLLDLRESRARPLALVTHLPIAPSRQTQVFHRVEIGGRVWKLLRQRDMLHIVLESSSRRAYDGGSAHIGDCTRVTYLDGETRRRRNGDGWYIVKYTDEVQISLAGMSIEAIAELAFQFGLDLDATMIESRKRFYASPAFKSLAVGLKSLRRAPQHVADPTRQNPYMGNWFAVARGAPIEAGLQYWFDPPLASAAPIDGTRHQNSA